MELLQTGGELRFFTKADLQGLEGLIEPAPDAYFMIKAKRYFLDVFTNVPSKVLYARVEAYSEYFFSNQWQKTTNTDFPTIIILCANAAIVRKLNRYIKNELPDEPDLRFVVSSDRSQVLKDGTSWASVWIAK